MVTEKQNGNLVVADEGLEDPERRVEFELEANEPNDKKINPADKEMMLIENSQKEDWMPDGGWGWAIIVGGVIVHVYLGGMMKTSGVMYLKLKDEYNRSAMATAWVFSVYITFMHIMGPVVSSLCLRFSCRSIVFWGSVLCFLGLFISAFSPNIELLYITYSVLGGLGRCMTYTPSLILVNRYFNKRRGLAVGITTAGVGLGMLTFPALIEILFSYFGYKWAMLLLAAISMETFLCAALFRPVNLNKRIIKTQGINNLITMARRGNTVAKTHLEQFITPKPRDKCIHHALTDNWNGTRDEELFRNKSVNSIQASKDVKKAPKKSMIEFSLLKNIQFLTLCIAIMLFTSSIMLVFVFFPPLAKSKGLSQMQASLLISIVGVSDSVARFTSASFLDMKRVKPYRLFVYNGAMFALGIVCLIMPSIEGFAGFAIIAACYGVCMGSHIAQKSVVVVDLLGMEKMTSSIGLVLGFQGIGALIGPTTAGYFRDTFGSFDEAFYFGGIGLFVGGFVLMYGNIWKVVRDRRNKRREKKTDVVNSKMYGILNLRMLISCCVRWSIEYSKENVFTFCY